MTANDVLQLRRGTAAEWTSADPTLRAGEIGWETDTNKLKIGDGVTAWTSLAYFTGGASGAPDDADYLVGTANGDLSAEIVVGTTPGGELGGTWASPTVDATHSGSTHSAATDAHIADGTDAHDASAISIADAGGDFTATDVEGALDELQADNEAHVAAGDPHPGYRLESADHTHESTGAQAGNLLWTALNAPATMDTEVTPATLTGNVNDWNPGGAWPAVYSVRVSTDATRSITGLDATGVTDGQVVFLENVGSNRYTLPHESASSAAANRFDLVGGATMTVLNDGVLILRYDTTDNRWRVIGRSFSINTSAPLAVVADGAGTAGDAGIADARNHVHGMATYSSTPAEPSGAGSAGTSGQAPSRGDHVHPATTFEAHTTDTSTHGVAEVAGIADITFETLDAAGDVGTGASQLAEGDHTHVGGGSTVDIEEDNAAVGTASVIDFGNGLDVGFAAGEAEVTVDLGEITAFTDHSARHENGGADEISIAGLDGTPTELTNHAAAADPHTGYLKESDLAGQHNHSANTAAGGGASLSVGTIFALAGEGDFTDTGTQNDLTPSNWASQSIFQWKGGSSLTINGLVAQGSGAIKVIHHEGTGIILFQHEAGGSSAANRLNLPLDQPFTLNQGEAAILEYNNDQQRWKIIGHSAGGDLTAHLEDTLAAHTASAIAIVDAGGDFTATTVEGALDELQADNEAHVAAGDPHTGYRLESADHTHASTGLQAGQLDHGTALTGLSDDDHPQYRLESESGTFTVGAFFDGNGSTLATGVRPIWRAPFDCTVTSVHAYVDTGTTTVVNAGTGAASGEDFCSSNITIDPADAWEAGTVNQNTAVTSGETVSVEIVTAGTATQLTIQIGFTRP